MTALCTRCGRRERFAKLLCCEACVNLLVGREPTPRQAEPFVPAWRKRSLSKDLSGWNRAA